MQQLGQLQADLEQFRASNAEVLAVAVQDQAGAQTTVHAAGVTYPVLSDADHAIADAYGVYNLLNDDLAAPAVFIIDTAGNIVWSYIGQSISDRPGNQTIFDNLP